MAIQVPHKAEAMLEFMFGPHWRTPLVYRISCVQNLILHGWKARITYVLLWLTSLTVAMAVLQVDKYMEGKSQPLLPTTDAVAKD